jgi:hypothetical protein
MYLVDIVVTRVIQVMADARSQQDERLKVPNLTGQFHTPYHGVHLRHMKHYNDVLTLILKLLCHSEVCGWHSKSCE